MSSSARRRALVVGMLVALVVVATWRLWPDPAAVTPTPVPAAQAITSGTVLHPAECHRPATRPFVPTRISVAHAAADARVLALPRDAHNVPQAPPLSSTGKTEFAWDATAIKPGDPRGNVLINAHTWPDGSALGNRLLANLQIGGRIVLRGDHGEELCYRVTQREVIVAADGSAKYYVQDGPPQVALIVCSPPRLGPGNWLHRTIWYASPMV